MTEASGGTGQHAGRRWDVALSFAGAQRDFVGQVARGAEGAGLCLLLRRRSAGPGCGGLSSNGTASGESGAEGRWLPPLVAAAALASWHTLDEGVSCGVRVRAVF